MAIQTQDLIRLSYLDKDLGQLRVLEVGSQQLDIAIQDSVIIKVTLRAAPNDSLYVNANRISLIEETESKATITLNHSTETIVYDLDETVSELNALVNSAIDSKQDVDVTSKTIQGTTYTLLAEDAGKILLFTSATTVAITIPILSNGFQVFASKDGAGNLDFVASGTTLQSIGTTLATQFTGVSIIYKTTTTVGLYGTLT